MANSTRSTRERLIESALQLFIAQGVNGTTTRQIADVAAVNEVTLFRQFGNKQGLLLAVIEESEAFQHLGMTLIEGVEASGETPLVLKKYASKYLHLLEQVPHLMRSLIGEAGQYSPAHRQALGQAITAANQVVADYLEPMLRQAGITLPGTQLVALLHRVLLGQMIVELTSESQAIGLDRDTILEHIITLIMQGSTPGSTTDTALSLLPSPPLQPPTEVQDLPAALVHQILRQAKKTGPQDYALAYVLFGAGLSPTEISALERADQMSDGQQHVLYITNPSRQVPVNQWIMGKRYGSYTANPLTKWLKSRKDKQPQMFLNAMDQPITPEDTAIQWQIWTETLSLTGMPLYLHQAQHTWMVDMLMRGIDIDNLSILTGKDKTTLHSYVKRAQCLAAISQATLLDRKSVSSP